MCNTVQLNSPSAEAGCKEQRSIVGWSCSSKYFVHLLLLCNIPRHGFMTDTSLLMFIQHLSACKGILSRFIFQNIVAGTRLNNVNRTLNDTTEQDCLQNIDGGER